MLSVQADPAFSQEVTAMLNLLSRAAMSVYQRVVTGGPPQVAQNFIE
jgi:hypothetical protein